MPGHAAGPGAAGGALDRDQRHRHQHGPYQFQRVLQPALTLTRDGRYTSSGSYGVSGSSNAGGSTASHAGTAARPDQDSRYKLEGYTLTLTACDGSAAVMGAFVPDPGSDGLPALNGANYLKDGR